VGKGISYSRDEGVTEPEDMLAAQHTAQDLSATGASSVVTPGGIASTGATHPKP
jgi:hypothetical protein